MSPPPLSLSRMTTAHLVRRRPASTVAARAASRWESTSDTRLWVRIVAVASIVLLGMKIQLPQSIEVGFVVAALLLPVWFGVLRRFRGAWILLGLGLVTLASGLALQLTTSVERDTNRLGYTANIVLLVGLLLSVGLVLWARTVLGTTRVLLWFGVGVALSLTPATTLFTSNPWKFGFALPTTLIALALARQSHRWWIELIVLLGLTGVSAFSDARSAFGLLLLAAILSLAQVPLLRRGHRGSTLLVFLGIVAVSVFVYFAGQALILNGYLGAATQERSAAQVAESGNLVLGGRPELAATLALMGARITGYGFGIAPSPADVQVAKTGMADIGYDPNNGYVDNFMFGGHMELHSVLGDVWAQAGIAGLAFVAVIAIVLVAGITRQITDGQASGAVLFVVASTLWNLAFSPLLTSERIMALAIGVALVPIVTRQRRTNSVIASTGPFQRVEALKPDADRNRVSVRAAAGE